MHIDRANQIPMPRKLASAAGPISPFGLVSMPTYRTAARCASFRAGEARDVSSFGFVAEVVNIFPILPQGQALIVMAAIVLLADAMGIANEEGSNLLINAEINHRPSRFVALVANASFAPSALLILRLLQLLPATRILLAPGLLLRNLAELLASQMFERTDAAPGDDQSRPGVRRDGCQVNLAQINRRLHSARSLFGLWDLDDHMQLKAIIPDQATRPAVFRQNNGQHQRWAILAHRQHHTPTFTRDRLSRPLDRIEAFGAPGILHLHLWLSLAQLVRCLNRCKKGAHYHLDRLTMQRKTPCGRFLQGVSSRPFRVGKASRFVRFHTGIPHVRSLHLRCFAALELLGGQVIQLVDFHRFHGTIVP